MADELNKDWQKEMEEQEAKRKEQDAEHERKMKSLHRWDAVAYCLQMVAIAFLATVVCFGAFELGRCLDLCAIRKPDKTSVVEAAAVKTTSLPRAVPDDIYRGYAALVGVQVPEFTGDGGLTPSPR